MTHQNKLETEYSNSISDIKLRKGIGDLVSNQPDYWDFKGISNKNTIHSITRYPAMMVAEMQRNIIEQIRLVAPNSKTVYDPFMGSGIVLVETIDLGLDFYGGDINPLAILICQVKSNEYDCDKLRSSLSNLKAKYNKDEEYEKIIFSERDKWFREDVADSLDKIHHAIKSKREIEVRRFFWVCLAETTRKVSNSRSTTFKMHIKSSDDIKAMSSDVMGVFEKIVKNNISAIRKHQKNRKNPTGKSYLSLNNIRNSSVDSKKYDIVITSPPYGDNKTTVPYGQFSYLPSQWIQFSDIGDGLNQSLAAYPQAVDSSSLGGSIRLDQKVVTDICTRLPKLKDFLDRFETKSDNYKKVASFFIDFEISMQNIISKLNDDGYIALTLGNRRVGNIIQPMNQITIDILLNEGCVLVHSFDRNIAHKVMAGKNKSVDTMGTEFVLIARKDK